MLHLNAIQMNKLVSNLFFLPPFFLLSHIVTNSHIDNFPFPHGLSRTPLHTLTRPHGEWCLHKCPLFPPPLSSFLSFSLLSLDLFSDMPAQAHLAAHAPPPTTTTTLSVPSLLPFTFLLCGITIATRKETSVLGEQCDGVGCSGYGGGSGFLLREEQRTGRAARAAGRRAVCPPRGGQDTAGPAAATAAPSELGLNVREGVGGG